MPRRGPRTRPLALAAVLAASAAPASPGDTLPTLLAALAQHPHEHVRFAEQTVSRVLKRPLHSEGELYFDAPDRLEKKTVMPAPEDLIVEGESVTVLRGAHRRSFRISDYPPLRPLLEGLRATLAGDQAALLARFAVSTEQTGADWLLTLQPLPDEAQPLYQRIQIRGHEGRVQTVRIERAAGEGSLMTLSDPDRP